jgi:microcystin-dependent protein
MGLTLLLALIFSSAANAQSQIPQRIAYQGYLADKNGIPVSGNLPADFTLFDAPSGGSQVWNERNVTVVVVNGYYSAILHFEQGWQNNNQRFDKPYWLEVHIGSQLLEPRFELTSAPYAMNARRADTAVVALGLVRDAPIGTIVAYGGDISFLKDREASTGWALCDGRKIARADFQTYYDVVRDAYGRSDDGDFVYLPDFRGMFLRGLNMSRSDEYADADASTRVEQREGGNTGNKVGSIQGDALGKHRHALTRETASATPAMTLGGNGWFGPNAETTGNYMGTTRDEGGSETRPVNAAVYWIIKVK